MPVVRETYLVNDRGQCYGPYHELEISAQQRAKYLLGWDQGQAVYFTRAVSREQAIEQVRAEIAGKTGNTPWPQRHEGRMS